MQVEESVPNAIQCKRARNMLRSEREIERKINVKNSEESETREEAENSEKREREHATFLVGDWEERETW